MPASLSDAQEARVIGYLDEQLLELSRAYETRKASRARFPTLSSYLNQVRQLLSFVLKIPPVRPSSELRIAYALSLTAVVPEALKGYFVDDARQLAKFLRALDKYWLMILLNVPYGGKAAHDQEARKSSVRMTDRVRLESIVYEIRMTLAEVLQGPRIVALTVNPFQDESAFLNPSIGEQQRDKQPLNREETPALTTDAESSAMSVDEAYSIGDDDEDEDDFDEVQVDDRTQTSEPELDIHFAAPANQPASNEDDSASPIPTRGFDPDEEYRRPHGIDEDDGDEDSDEDIQVAHVFERTIKLLDASKT